MKNYLSWLSLKTKIKRQLLFTITQLYLGMGLPIFYTSGIDYI